MQPVGVRKRVELLSTLTEGDINFGESLEICLIAVLVEFAMVRDVKM